MLSVTRRKKGSCVCFNQAGPTASKSAQTAAAAPHLHPHKVEPKWRLVRFHVPKAPWKELHGSVTKPMFHKDCERTCASRHMSSGGRPGPRSHRANPGMYSTGTQVGALQWLGFPRSKGSVELTEQEVGGVGGNAEISLC